MSWEDQGRQEHGWFGHGTAPPKLKPDENDRGGRFGLDGLDQRLQAIGHTAIAALPRVLRHHPAARYDEGPALDQLVTTMRGWVRGLLLDRAEFARRYFGRAANDPVVDHLWQAAKFAAVARNEAELRTGTEHLAAAMQAEGLDRWRQFMNDTQQRATAAARLPVPSLSGNPKPTTPSPRVTLASSTDAAIGLGALGLLGLGALIMRPSAPASPSGQVSPSEVGNGKDAKPSPSQVSPSGQTGSPTGPEDPEGTPTPSQQAALPDNPSQLRHIFRDAPGHLPDTPANRKLLEDIANDPKSVLGTDNYGNVWSARTLPDGTQIWTQVRGERIVNGGLNQVPRAFSPKTGLSAPDKL